VYRAPARKISALPSAAAPAGKKNPVATQGAPEPFSATVRDDGEDVKYGRAPRSPPRIRRSAKPLSTADQTGPSRYHPDNKGKSAAPISFRALGDADKRPMLLLVVKESSSVKGVLQPLRQRAFTHRPNPGSVRRRATRDYDQLNSRLLSRFHAMSWVQVQMESELVVQIQAGLRPLLSHRSGIRIQPCSALRSAIDRCRMISATPGSHP